MKGSPAKFILCVLKGASNANFLLLLQVACKTQVHCEVQDSADDFANQHYSLALILSIEGILIITPFATNM